MYSCENVSNQDNPLIKVPDNINYQPLSSNFQFGFNKNSPDKDNNIDNKEKKEEISFGFKPKNEEYKPISENIKFGFIPNENEDEKEINKKVDQFKNLSDKLRTSHKEEKEENNKDEKTNEEKEEEKEENNKEEKTVKLTLEDKPKPKSIFDNIDKGIFGNKNKDNLSFGKNYSDLYNN